MTCVASILVLNTVSSSVRPPTYEPVLTSMVVIASVWSIIKYPPDFNATRVCSAF